MCTYDVYVYIYIYTYISTPEGDLDGAPDPASMAERDLRSVSNGVSPLEISTTTDETPEARSTCSMPLSPGKGFQHRSK